jgi:cellulose synthase/poly-beta-1,6-N-acetylglucosamine synthase-like glycosyltransferase
MHPELISVVVPAYNAERSIGRCISALQSQSLPGDRYEIIVVDDASCDQTAQVAQTAGARVLRLDQNVGAAGARNAGVAIAKGDIIVFTDADCEPTHSFLSELVAPLDDPDVGGAKGTYLTRQRSLVARFVQLEYESRYRRMRRFKWIDFVDTYAACYRKTDFERVGGFDVKLRKSQDYELSFRLAAAGVRIRFVPAAQTYHLHADSLGEYLRKKNRIAWWKVAILRRHPEKAISDSHTPQTMKLEIAAACAALATTAAAPLLAASGLAGLGWLFSALTLSLFMGLALPFAVRALSRDPAAALVSPGFLFLRDLALAAGFAQGIIQSPRLDAVVTSEDTSNLEHAAVERVSA